MSCGDRGEIRERRTDPLLRFSWLKDKRVDVEREESLQLEALRNRRRRGRVAGSVIVIDDDWSMRLQGLK